MDIKNINASSKEPLSLNTMTTEEFNSMMETGLSQAKSDKSRPISDVFADAADGYGSVIL